MPKAAKAFERTSRVAILRRISGRTQVNLTVNLGGILGGARTSKTLKAFESASRVASAPSGRAAIGASTPPSAAPAWARSESGARSVEMRRERGRRDGGEMEARWRRDQGMRGNMEESYRGDGREDVGKMRARCGQNAADIALGRA